MPRRSSFRFKTLSVKQQMVLTWWVKSSPVRHADGIVCDGAIRSGKTISMSLSFAMWAMENFDGKNFALCGKTVGSARRNIVLPLKAMLYSRGYHVKEKLTENLVTVRRGDRENYFYIFGGKDESSAGLIQGLTLGGVLFDEVALMPRSFVKQATARCSEEGSKFWFNCNPEGPRHWFYEEWIKGARDRNVLYLHFMMTDNLSLSAEMRARYERLYKGVFYDRYIRGLWVVAEGIVYTMFDPKKHVVPNPTHPVPAEFERYYISCDYGTVNPSSFGLWGLNEGKWYRVREYYWDSKEEGQQRTDEEHYKALVELADGLPPGSIEKVIVDPSAASFIECIARHGVFYVDGADNAVVDGIREVATHLNLGDIFFCDCCEDCIREFGLYRWDEKAKEDRPLKVDDHAMDDVRYFVRAAFKEEDFGFEFYN